MKKNILKYILVAITPIIFYACTKSDGVINQAYEAYGVTATQGFLKINLASAYTVSYSTFMLKVNGKVVGSALSQRTPYPGGGYNTNGSSYALYLSVPQGADTVSLVIPKVGTNADSIVYYSTVVNIPDNSTYTLHICDTLVNTTTNNTKSVLIKNPSSGIDTNYCVFRFIHMMPNVPAVDLYLNGILMKSNVAYLQPTDTFRVATGIYAPGFLTSGGVPKWEIRVAGALATSTALASYGSGQNALQSQKIMTIFSMGYNGLTSTAQKPYLCFTLDNNQ